MGKRRTRSVTRYYLVTYTVPTVDSEQQVVEPAGNMPDARAFFRRDHPDAKVVSIRKVLSSYQVPK